MYPKFIILTTLLIMAAGDTTVKKSDQCSACTQFKSQNDCNSFGCLWTAATTTSAGSCAKAVVATYTGYCPGLDKPETICASTFGCAFVDSKCLNFAGCSAYVKSSTLECQAISTNCISDGTVCTDALECQSYSSTQCTSNPDLNGRKCTLDSTTNTCRNYNCSEADATYTTDTACIAYSPSCVTTGAGCVTSPLPQCGSFTGTATTCLLMKGSDGPCKLGSGTNCVVKQCTDAPTSTAQDTDCNKFITGCVTTGKGCIGTLGSCTQYTVTNPVTDCQGYVGTDGVCEGDSGQTTCRPRKCENGTGTTDALCDTYKKGCVTTGKACISSRGACSSYSGTISNCQGYIGTDGNCKGTNATTAGPCAPKVCTTDSNTTYTTDTQCKGLQSNCVTTGAGCVISPLQSCSTYTFTATDGSDCLNLVGSEGKCKAGTGGKCAAKVCTDAPTTTTSNADCNTFKTGCVSNGAGCIAQTTCVNTISQTACQGTIENSAPCNSNPICVDNTSCNFATQALCATQKAVSGSGDNIVYTQCIWINNSCRAASCSDYTGSSYQTDLACSTALTGCVTNGTGCVEAICPNLKGTQETCLSYKGNCTNISAAGATDACLSKTCSDSWLTFTSDDDCANYLTGCITNGNGCISNTANCSSYTGTQSQCDLFYGYDNGSIKGTRCWNTSTSSPSACVVKSCSLASSMTSNSDCKSFFPGCLFAGNGTCIVSTATCSQYSGSSTSACQDFIGNGKPCWWESGNNCTDRVCTQNQTATSNPACNTFLSGCLTNGAGCVDPTKPCNSYSGTSDVCNGFVGNGIKCTRLESCTVKACSNKTNATSNADCLTYRTNCRLKQGTQICQDEQSACTSYGSFASGASASDKLAYCNVLTISDKKTLCGYDSSVTATCSTRTCALWSSTIANETCPNYVSANGCRLSTGNNVCYAPGACNTYSPPSSITALADQITWCNNMLDNSTTPLQCTFSSAGTCTDIIRCEDIPSQTSAANCNIFLQNVNCQYANSKCITTQQQCTGYSLTDVSTGQSAYCLALKASDTSVITPCKYDSGTTGTCVNKTSVDVSSPTSQADCEKVFPGKSKYYSGVCYIIDGCTSYAFPSSVTSTSDKQLFCQNMYDYLTTYFCAYDSTANSNAGACIAPVATCADYSTLPSGSELAFCNAARIQTGQMCTFTSGTTCNDPSDVCALITSGATSDAYCDLYTTPKMCVASSGACALRTVTCTNTTPTGSDDTSKQTSCQSTLDSSGKYCSFTAGGTKCSAPKACTDYGGLNWISDNSAFCNSKIDQDGTPCSYFQGKMACKTRYLCEDAVNVQSQADCDAVSIGCQYSFLNKSCYATFSCISYLAVGADAAAKRTFCQGLISNPNYNKQCTYVDGITCIQMDSACGSTLTTTDATVNLAKCKAVGCTYYQQMNCASISTCDGYNGGTTTNCSLVQDTNGLFCIAGNSNSCISVTICESIVSPGSQADCDKFMSGCLFYSSQCYTSKNCSDYSSLSQGYCAAMKDKTSNEYCTLNNNTGMCKARTCADVVYPTHTQCKAYLSSCKSDGTKCIDASITCANQSGVCSGLLDIDNVNSCVSATSLTPQGACSDRLCNQNIVATTNEDCEAYLTGCLTTGLGCISKTEPCGSYQGTLTQCKKFTGSDGPCWGTTTTGACRPRTCADNATATTDLDCIKFLSTCLTNGAGCLVNTSPCNAYKGTQTTCKDFTGTDGACWNTSSANGSSSCQLKTCSLFPGTTDFDCDNFMPANPDATVKNCVTNGTNCIVGTTTCSGFKGTNLTCSNFTAFDGPCKANTTSVGPCTPRICTEAPNNLATDADCKKYHPTCVTTGKGCITNTSCSYVQIQSACSARTGCAWAPQCRAAPTSCPQMSIEGLSICTNTLLNDGVTKCAWSGSTCRNFLCTDYDVTITTHAGCQSQNKSCTTSGAGCVTYSTCNTYTTQSICQAANTTEVSIRCGWDNASAKCRQRICTDNTTATTNADCNSFLTGCKTSGLGCIGPFFACSAFLTQQFCLINGNNYPCVWVGGYCQEFADCTDAIVFSLTECQAYNSLCVPSSTSCIAQTSCDKYTEQISCSVGVNNTVCGWLPTGKCQVFGTCSDAAGTSNTDCSNYSSTCITDGTKCVAIGSCQSYLTQTACGNQGTDGQCTWVASSSSCRLAVCSDKTLKTDSECLAYIVSAGKCTSDGTTCVARATCNSYTTQAACTIGSDGIPCIYAYPVGQTTGTQSCRAKECSDITGITNDQCIGQIAGKSCVSNGKVCVKQDTCANFKNKLSCNAGGSDGVCAFTPAATATDALAGTCQLFTSCDKANNDSAACNTKQSACQWTSTVSGTTTTTSCAAKNCVQAASGTICNYIPSFDGTKYTICNLVNNICTASDPLTLAQGTCYSKSAYAYTWDDSTSKCVSCTGSTNNTVNNTNSTNNPDNTTTTNGYILGVSIPLVIMGLFA